MLIIWCRNHLSHGMTSPHLDQLAKTQARTVNVCRQSAVSHDTKLHISVSKHSALPCFLVSRSIDISSRWFVVLRVIDLVRIGSGVETFGGQISHLSPSSVSFFSHPSPSQSLLLISLHVLVYLLFSQTPSYLHFVRLLSPALMVPFLFYNSMSFIFLFHYWK